MGKSRTIRINENDLKRLIAEKINEYSDWKTQMLDAGNTEGYKKAQKLASRKHAGTGVSDNGTSYRNFVSVEPESGFFGSEERTGDGNFMMHGTSIKPKSGDNGDIDSYSDTITSDGFVGNDKYPISSPEAEKFQDDARKDMEDYYSGNFKKRMQSKAKSLPNAQSGQDFTPKSLKEGKKIVKLDDSKIRAIIMESLKRILK